MNRFLLQRIVGLGLMKVGSSMRRLLIIPLLITNCVSLNNNHQTVERKSALIIEHFQSVVGTIIPDSLKNANYPMFLIDPCWDFHYCDSIRTEAMNEFVANRIDTEKVILLSEQGYNLRPINCDFGGSIYQYAVASYPFKVSFTRYNAKDSCQLMIDSISADYSVFLRINNHACQINSGDSLIWIDTAYGRTDSTYCWQQLLITQKIVNAGMDSLPNEKYIRFF